MIKTSRAQQLHLLDSYYSRLSTLTSRNLVRCWDDDFAQYHHCLEREVRDERRNQFGLLISLPITVKLRAVKHILELRQGATKPHAHNILTHIDSWLYANALFFYHRRWIKAEFKPRECVHWLDRVCYPVLAGTTTFEELYPTS